jgi:hypothetical protein
MLRERNTMNPRFDPISSSLSALVLCLGAASGCDAQVGEDYQGEPLLSVQGTVLLNDTQSGEDLVPALVLALPPDNEFFFDVIDGEVTGDFPAEFRFDVMTPPPERSLGDYKLPSGERVGTGALAFLAMLPKDHPPAVAMELGYAVCPEDARTCTEEASACVGERCRQRTYECVREAPCDSVTFGSEVEGQDLHWTERSFNGNALYVSRTSCTVGGECLFEFKSCVLEADSRASDSFEFPVETCTHTTESGDTSILSTRDMKSFVREYYVQYWTTDVAIDGLTMKRGYSLLELLPYSFDAFQDEVVCGRTRAFELMAEYNRANGTSYHPDDAPEDLRRFIWREVAAACPTRDVRVVENPLEESLTISLGSSRPR